MRLGCPGCPPVLHAERVLEGVGDGWVDPLTGLGVGIPFPYLYSWEPVSACVSGTLPLLGMSGLCSGVTAGIAVH